MQKVAEWASQQRRDGDHSGSGRSIDLEAALSQVENPELRRIIEQVYRKKSRSRMQMERSRAPGHCVLRRGQGLPPLSPHPFSACDIVPSLRFGAFLLTKPITSSTIREPASLRSDS
jgi:hypothetical protein